VPDEVHNDSLRLGDKPSFGLGQDHPRIRPFVAEVGGFQTEMQLKVSN
jgi:hypothetical protein